MPGRPAECRETGISSGQALELLGAPSLIRSSPDPTEEQEGGLGGSEGSISSEDDADARQALEAFLERFCVKYPRLKKVFDKHGY